MVQTATLFSLFLLLIGMGMIGGGTGSASAQATSTDQTAPVISGVGVSNLTHNAGAINWTTNEPADGQIEYGTSTAYGTVTPIFTATTTAHQITLAGLNAVTTYHYMIKSKDEAGNLATSTDLVFTTTAPADVTGPVITGITTTGITQTSAMVTWTTNEPADSQVQYGTSSSYGLATSLDTATITMHTVTLSGLTAGTTYHYAVKSKDQSGNLSTSTDVIFTTLSGADTVAPVITGVSATNIGMNSVMIVWTTNEGADSQVLYGTSSNYGLATSIATTLVTAHQITISGLAAGTTYHYAVRSKDAAGNTSTSTNAIVTTATAPNATSTPSTAGVKLKVEPRVLNATSMGKEIEATLTIQGIYRNSDLDRTSIKLNNAVAPSRTKVKIQYTYDEEEGERGSMKIQMKFPREEVVRTLVGDITSSTTAQVFTKEIVVSATLAGQTIVGTTQVRIFAPSWRNILTDYRKVRDQIREEYKEKKEEVRERVKLEQEALKEIRSAFKEREKEISKKIKEQKKEEKKEEKGERKDD